MIKDGKAALLACSVLAAVISSKMSLLVIKSRQVPLQSEILTVDSFKLPSIYYSSLQKLQTCRSTH